MFEPGCRILVLNSKPTEGNRMILVTGGTGLVGAHLLYELTSRGESVRALKRERSNTEFVDWVFKLYSHESSKLLQGIEWVDGDLLDYQSLLDATKGVQTVYHTGGIVSFNPLQSSSVIETNITGTGNLVDACMDNGVKEICHVSSIAALGQANESGMVDEDCRWIESKGQNAYAVSKLYGENQLWRGFAGGLRVIVVNPTVILGPGRWDSGSGQLFKRVYKGMPFYTNGVTGFVDVRDVARAMVVLMEETGINGERFILNSENVSYRDIFTMMAASLGKRKPSIRVPAGVVDAVYPLVQLFGQLSGRGNLVSKANLKTAFRVTLYSSQKIREKIGFEFIPIEETIRFVGKAFRNAEP
jgi:nucleoside-diphosphate-sugar epimerase